MNEGILQEIDELFRGKPFLTLEDITQLLGCSERVVYNWTKRADPDRRPPKIVVGKSIRFPKRDFIHWLIKEQSGKRSEEE